MFQIVSGMENVQGIEGRGAYHDSLSKLFCLTEPKNFRRGTPMCSKIFSASTFFWIREGGTIIFCRVFFASQYRNFS